VRFASCLHQGVPLAALIDGETAIPLRGISELGRQTPTSVLASPPLDRAGALPLADVTFRPVIPDPSKVICVGLNYRSHVSETGRSEMPYPVLFTKFASSLIGPDDPIVCPPASRQVDYEAELAVIIGRTTRRIAPPDALSCVAGYTVANDVSMRDFQYQTHQWLQGKAWDNSTPLGPVLVTPNEVPGPADMRITLTLNGRLLQDATADLMIFSVAELISTVSQFATLWPGDVLLTGTPGGVGMRRDPQVFLRPDDVVSVAITGVGRIENPVVAGD
jgi:acylpyruvate hydrolase